MAEVAGPKKLAKNETLFREGDAPAAAYVVKSGKIAITKNKGDKEIELAQIGPGSMFGEMAFFDGQPRSANAKALAESVVISLPFSNLQAQFKTFPEWLKVMVRTINDNLRDANKRIKNLEKAPDENERFSPHAITKLCAILGLVTSRYGRKEETGLVIAGSLLRRYTIQIFQDAPAKMQEVMEVLQKFEILTVEDAEAGNQKITVKKLDQLIAFVEYYNDYIFKDESKRTTIERLELNALKALVHYGPQNPAEKDGRLKVDLTMVKENSLKDLGQQVKIEEYDSLVHKKIVSEKAVESNGGVSVKFNFDEVNAFYQNWSITYAIRALDKKL